MTDELINITPKPEPQNSEIFETVNTEADFSLDSGAYEVQLKGMPMRQGEHKYIAKVVVLAEDDEEVIGDQKQHDPFSLREFVPGEKVIRLAPVDDEKDTPSVTFRLDSVMLVNPTLKKESFKAVEEGEIK